jgi:uncharacterized membrane protein
MDWSIVLLRIVHIGAGMFWVGGAFTFFLFIAPSTEVLAPPARKAFLDQVVERRRYPTAILAAATLAILAGAVLYWRNSGGLNVGWVTSPSGLGFTIGGLAGLAAWLVAAVVISPTFNALSGLTGKLVSAGRPPTPEEGARVASLGTRLRIAGRALLVLLAVAVVLMASSRYIY